MMSPVSRSRSQAMQSVASLRRSATEVPRHFRHITRRRTPRSPSRCQPILSGSCISPHEQSWVTFGSYMIRVSNGYPGRPMRPPRLARSSGVVRSGVLTRAGGPADPSPRCGLSGARLFLPGAGSCEPGPLAGRSSCAPNVVADSEPHPPDDSERRSHGNADCGCPPDHVRTPAPEHIKISDVAPRFALQALRAHAEGRRP